jgi:hypothetical protein
LPLAVGATCGTWLYYSVLLPSVTNVNWAATGRIADSSQVVEHLRALPGAWLAFLQPLAFRGPASAFEAALSLGGGLLALGLVACVAFRLWQGRKVERDAYTVGWLAASSLVLTLGALVASGSLYQGYLEIRYALLGIVLAVPVTVHTMKRGLASHPVARVLATVLLAAFCVGLACQWHSPSHPPLYLLGAYRERQALIETLSRHHVRRVLATYWNSYVLSILSRGALRSFPIVVRENGVGSAVGFTYLGTDLDVPEERAAIVLAETDGATAAVWDGVRQRFGPPRQELRSDPFRVWIYDNPRLHWVLGAGPRIDAVLPESRLRLNVDKKRLGGPCGDPKGCAVRLRVTNGGIETLSSRGDRPLRIGVQALDHAGNVRRDVARLDFERTLVPGESGEFVFPLPRNEDPEVADYRVCLLQESVAWLCHRTRLLAETSPSDVPEAR